MSRRFYIKGPLEPGHVRLAGAEAHHLVHVLRIGRGQSVTLFDGSGFEAVAELQSTAEDAVELTVLQIRAASAESAVSIVLATAVPKGDRFTWLIEKATELGVERFVPLITERSVVVPGEGKLARMRRTIVEASKQCGRNRLMELAEPIGWREFVERELAMATGWVAHLGGEPFDTTVKVAGRPLVAAVGPEGGFTEAELELAVASGARLVALGPRVLRIETAALALAALFTVYQ
jgi:16S rRNA (uracil1498-N3)-methyltransferase